VRWKYAVFDQKNDFEFFTFLTYTFRNVKNYFLLLEKNSNIPKLLICEESRGFFQGKIVHFRDTDFLFFAFIQNGAGCLSLCLSVSHRVSSPTPSPTPSSEPSTKEPETRASSPRWCSLVLVNGLVDVYCYDMIFSYYHWHKSSIKLIRNGKNQRQELVPGDERREGRMQKNMSCKKTTRRASSGGWIRDCH